MSQPFSEGAVDEASLSFGSEVRAVVERRAYGPLENFSHDHAAVLLEYIFSISVNAVDILCERLKAEAYGNQALIDAAVLFTHRGGRIRVVVEEDLSWHELRSGNPFVEAMVCRGRIENFDIRYAGPSSSLQPENFAVGDLKHYRGEHSRGIPSAQGDFFCPDVAAPLGDRFEGIWAAALPVDRGEAPSTVNVHHEISGDLHTFTADEVPGLFACGLEADKILRALPRLAGGLVSLKRGVRTHYRLGRTDAQGNVQLERDDTPQGPVTL